MPVLPLCDKYALAAKGARREGAVAVTATGKNRIMFLAISIPRTEAAVIMWSGRSRLRIR
jgi:hypothetical protein